LGDLVGGAPARVSAGRDPQYHPQKPIGDSPLQTTRTARLR
jgi:hypothetical protein